MADARDQMVKGRPRTSECAVNALVEQPAISLFAELGWETLSCFHETYGAGRDTQAEVVLAPRLRAALRKPNATAPEEAISLVIEGIALDMLSRSWFRGK